MKLSGKGRKRLLVSVLVVVLTLLTGPVLAGGWAVITMDELPGEIHAGESVRMSFMVQQHGKTPVHFLGDSDIAVEPVISGTNVKTGEIIEISAVVDKSEVGRFYADVVFPADGEWEWTVEPNPLAGATEFAPLTILPPLKAPVVGSSSVNTASEAAVVSSAETAGATGVAHLSQEALLGAVGLVLVAGVGLAGVFMSRRKRELTVAVDAGD
jgi:hypothetical protein